jgi:hypothetical protein
MNDEEFEAEMDALYQDDEALNEVTFLYGNVDSITVPPNDQLAQMDAERINYKGN